MGKVSSYVVNLAHFQILPKPLHWWKFPGLKPTAVRCIPGPGIGWDIFDFWKISCEVTRLHINIPVEIIKKYTLQKHNIQVLIYIFGLKINSISFNYRENFVSGE